MRTQPRAPHGGRRRGRHQKKARPRRGLPRACRGVPPVGRIRPAPVGRGSRRLHQADPDVRAVGVQLAAFHFEQRPVQGAHQHFDVAAAGKPHFLGARRGGMELLQAGRHPAQAVERRLHDAPFDAPPGHRPGDAPVLVDRHDRPARTRRRSPGLHDLGKRHGLARREPPLHVVSNVTHVAHAFLPRIALDAPARRHGAAHSSLKVVRTTRREKEAGRVARTALPGGSARKAPCPGTDRGPEGLPAGKARKPTNRRDAWPPGGRAAHAATAARPGSRQDPPTRQAGGTWRSPRWPGSTSDGWEAAAPLHRRACGSSGSRRRCRHALVPEAGR